MPKQKKSSKADKHRKSGQNLAYKGEHRHEKSHIRRIKAHMTRFKHDKVAESMLMKYAEKLGLNALNSAKEFLDQQHRS